MTSEKSQRILIWWALISATVMGPAYYFLVGFLPPPSATLNAAEVALLYSTDNMELRIGVVIMLITAGFQLPWTIVVSVQMARLERGVPVWSIMQCLAGALGVTLFVAPPLLWGVAAYTVDRAPEITLLMHELAFLVLTTPVSFFLLQAVPIAVVVLSQKDVQHSAFPRWIGYFSGWMALIAECGVLAMLFRTGPFSWNGLFVFWLPLGVFGIYFTVISLYMLKALKLQEQAAETG